MLEIEQILSYKGWIVGGFFLLFLLFEHLKPAVKAGDYAIWRLVKNLSFWPINIGLSLIIIVPLSYFAAQYAFWERPNWLIGISGLLFDFLILDLFLYCWHRTVHEIPFLWRFHEVHHLDQHLDSTSAIRFHFGEIFFAVIFRTLLILLFAIPFSSVVIFEILVLVFTLFHHSNMALPDWLEKLLSKIIVTPGIHWVHHHAVRKDTDSNYSTIFSFWDRLFNTKSKTKRFQR